MSFLVKNARTDIHVAPLRKSSLCDLPRQILENIVYVGKLTNILDARDMFRLSTTNKLFQTIVFYVTGFSHGHRYKNTYRDEMKAEHDMIALCETIRLCYKEWNFSVFERENTIESLNALVLRIGVLIMGEIIKEAEGNDFDRSMLFYFALYYSKPKLVEMYLVLGRDANTGFLLNGETPLSVVLKRSHIRVDDNKLCRDLLIRFGAHMPENL